MTNMADSPNNPEHKPMVLPPTLIAAPSAIAQQGHLFYRKALIEYPPSSSTADSLGEVEADDYHRYYIKGDAHGRSVRASEWICTHIAEEVRVGAPAPMVVELASGGLVFGSRRIAGSADITITAAYLTSQTVSNLSPASTGLGPILSGIYALDLFLHNDDRHLGNYLSVDDNGVRRLYAFDFSRALFWAWPWSGFPPKGCNTRICGEVLRALHGFDTVAATAIIDRIAALPLSTVEGFMNRMPSDWLTEQKRSDFSIWWENGARQQRLDALRAGISDGSLL
jgi:hypothetical protein